MSFQRDRPSAPSQIESSDEFGNLRARPHNLHCPVLIGPLGGSINQW